MAVNRYKGIISTDSGNHTDFPLWLFVSVAIHLVPAIVIVLIPRVPRREFRPPVYQVELMTRPEAVISEEAPKNEELIPREEPKVEPEVKVKDIIKPKAIKKSKKEVVIPKPKHKEDAARPDDAIAKMREKVAAEEAVERIRKKVSEKEPTSSGGIKIATKAPAKVYHYEELDDEMKAYYATIRQIIRNAWILPDELRNKGYKAELAIKVLKDGTVQGSWIYKKSGNNYFDDTAVRAINKVTTLPPLPDGWKEGSIDFGFYFPYKERY
ncbi:MAG: TonB family protein [Deltaproteobacteria bacterium]